MQQEMLDLPSRYSKLTPPPTHLTKRFSTILLLLLLLLLPASGLRLAIRRPQALMPPGLSIAARREPVLQSLPPGMVAPANIVLCCFICL
ncbi:hypothetical protein EDC52_106169 [Biostraticola tofi]|uniref:Uncharacterized protein n=1 Tax=Biostraticola tofi TaxID=466109 RepID=A0A4R3YU30_9GAMM|nr:hypothetical protein EDC52_106169 [Biostraticola tofi]